MAHQVLGGSVPFHDEALFYRIHVLDVVRAIEHALAQRTVGTFNLTHPELPPRLQPYFDALSELDGLPPLTYRNELRAPTQPVSVDALLGTGFVLEHTVVETMPDMDAPREAREVPPVDGRGGDIVRAVLARLTEELDLVERTGDDGDALLPLHAIGGPLDGTRIGEFRVLEGRGVRLVYSRLSVDELGMDTHQVYAFTAPDSVVPHLFLDTAISPNTGGTFHVGVDLVPRVDLGATLDYTLEVYDPLTEPRAEALAAPGVMPVPSLGPLQWSLRSPWMVAAIVAPEDLVRLDPVISAYVDQWLGLVGFGLSDDSRGAASWQDLPMRDRQNRLAMFSARTNPVWILLDRLVGPESAARMRALLVGEA
jgi:hypothetical protein